MPELGRRSARGRGTGSDPPRRKTSWRWRKNGSGSYVSLVHRAGTGGGWMSVGRLRRPRRVDPVLVRPGSSWLILARPGSSGSWRLHSVWTTWRSVRALAWWLVRAAGQFQV